jgi:hypothetical protein
VPRALAALALTIGVLTVPLGYLWETLTFEPPVYRYDYQDATIAMTTSCAALALTGALALLLVRSTRRSVGLWVWWSLLLLAGVVATAAAHGRIAGGAPDTTISPGHVDVRGAVEVGLLLPTLWPLYLTVLVALVATLGRAFTATSRPAPRSRPDRSSTPARPPYGG